MKEKEIFGFAIYNKARKVIEYLGEEWVLINPESEFNFYISNKKLNKINLTFLNVKNDIYSVSIQDNYGHIFDKMSISMLESPKSIANLLKKYLIDSLEKKYESKFKKIIEKNKHIAEENYKLIQCIDKNIKVHPMGFLNLKLSFASRYIYGYITEDTINNTYSLSINSLNKNALIKLSEFLKDL